MDKSDKVRFSEIMMGISQNFSANLDNNGLRMMFDALSEYTLEQVYSASIAIMKTRVYTTMPTVAEYVSAMSGGEQVKAIIQFGQLRKAIAGEGRNGSPKFRDPTTHYLVHELFGWTAICSKQESEMVYFKREFVDNYKRLDSMPELPMIETPGPEIKQLPNVVKKLG